MFIDAAISVSLININDSSKWPNMHPWIRIYFIPVVGTFFAIIASAIELIRNIAWKTSINKFPLWILLGASYTTVLSVLALGRVLPIQWAYLLMALCVLAFNPIVIHFYFGRSQEIKV